MVKLKFQVAWTESAVRDLEEIVLYIAADSISAARKMLRTIQKKATSLETIPERGRGVPELLQIGIRAYRELIAQPYRIVYRVSEHSVFILSVLDSRCDLEDLLLERLLGQSGRPGV